MDDRGGRGAGHGSGYGSGYGGGDGAGYGRGPGPAYGRGSADGSEYGAGSGYGQEPGPAYGRGGEETMRLGAFRPGDPAPSDLSDPSGGSGAYGAGREDGHGDSDGDGEDAAGAHRTGGRAERRRAAKRIKRRRRLSATKEIPLLIGIALLIALVLKTFLVQAFVIPSGSMEETIRIGDRVLVDKLTPWFGSKPERGDIVVFRDPGGWLSPEETQQKDDPAGVKQVKEALTFIGLLPSEDEQDLIKRVVAVGGDHIRCCDRHGRVTVNGKPLNEPYLHPGNRPSDMKFDVHVPIGKVFVMGDHRANSADSRYHLRDAGQGTVPEDQIVGRALVIAWPFDHWRRLEEPGTYASVPDPPGAATAADGTGENRPLPIPSPAELPIVMGVVGLSRISGRLQRIGRSDRGGLGGRRSVRFRRRRVRGHRRRWPGSGAP